MSVKSRYNHGIDPCILSGKLITMKLPAMHNQSKQNMKKVLLSFDIEEFDMPTEYGKEIMMHKQLLVSQKGTEMILDLLQRHKVKATFFCTAVFALAMPDLIARITREGHELASHGFSHSTFSKEDLLRSRLELEVLSGQPVQGFRMARMMPVDATDIVAAGYTYNSSLNPVYLPGRYNNFFKPRRLFTTGTLQQLPASATPIIRLPLFWLSFHNLPLWLYKAACRWTINNDKYLNLYFHPWEFTDTSLTAYGLPKYVVRNSGVDMYDRFEKLLIWMKKKGYGFETMNRFLSGKRKKIDMLVTQ